MSSSPLGDFGPLTERRHAENARKQRRRIMIAAGTVSIIIILIVMGSAAVMYSGKKSSSDGGSGHKSSSKGSSSPAKDYTDACEKSLGKAANASSSSHKDIVHSAVEVIGDAISQAFDRADLILSNDPRVKAAVADCKEVFADAKDDLNSTLKGVDDKDGIAKQSYQLRIWLSAVIANMETCVEGFPNDEFKAKVTESFTDGSSRSRRWHPACLPACPGLFFPVAARLVKIPRPPLLLAAAVPARSPPPPRAALGRSPPPLYRSTTARASSKQPLPQLLKLEGNTGTTGNSREESAIPSHCSPQSESVPRT
ncbi:putative pectinesterase/pectinesterase inhibitor 45 [Miscanthus floridulus]|uniref:putative pectinesterase/pectinesterase inhibitor 45 n=1 Tax=Miscanthus floridulus TaxID=154761 RepID=UPI00345908E5